MKTRTVGIMDYATMLKWDLLDALNEYRAVMIGAHGEPVRCPGRCGGLALRRIIRESEKGGRYTGTAQVECVDCGATHRYTYTARRSGCGR